MAYGANVPDIFRRAAEYVDRILKGANLWRSTDPGAIKVPFHREYENGERSRDYCAAIDPRSRR
jgi:hypothetical protein